MKVKDILLIILYITIIISFFILSADTLHRMIRREKTITLTEESIKLNKIIIEHYKEKNNAK